MQGLPFRLVHIDLSAKPAWYRAITPRGLVPALQHNGQVHLESADICRWLDGAFDSGQRLVPEDPLLQQEMEALLSGPCSGAVSAGLDLMAGACARPWVCLTGWLAGFLVGRLHPLCKLTF
jgi:glutathione S-transferase